MEMELEQRLGYEITEKDVKWALWFAKRQGKKHPALEDEFESEVLVTLAWCAQRYNPDCGVKFWSFASSRIRGAIVDVQRHWRPKGWTRRGEKDEDEPNTVSLDSVNSDGRTAKDTLVSADDPVGWELEHQDEVEGFGRRLPATYRKVFVAYHQTGRTQVEVARLVGCSESRVSQILDDAPRFLVKRFTPHDQFMSGVMTTPVVVPTTPVAKAVPVPVPVPAAKAVMDPLARKVCGTCGAEKSKERNRCYRCVPGWFARKKIG